MIYILEDDDSIRKLVTYALESQGFEAEGFPAPSAFWEAMEKETPELLLLDIILRRSNANESPDSKEYRFGDLLILPDRHEVLVRDEEISLTHKEYQLLLLLVKNEGNVLTREVLLDRIWDLGSEPENRTLDVHIRKLRSKLGDIGSCIETMRSVGYRFRMQE